MPKKAFNLLRPQVEPPTVWTKLYDYVVGTARIIVIVVELVVVVAFAIRIVVDVQSKNLDEEIAIKESIIATFAQAELRFREIQDKTRSFETIWTKSEEFSENYAEINNYLPATLAEFTVQITADTVFVTGSATNEDIQRMEESLNNSTRFTKKIDEITSEGGAGNILATFTIRSDIKKKTFKELTLVATEEESQNLVSPTPTPSL